MTTVVYLVVCGQRAHLAVTSCVAGQHAAGPSAMPPPPLSRCAVGQARFSCGCVRQWRPVSSVQSGAQYTSDASVTRGTPVPPLPRQAPAPVCVKPRVQRVAGLHGVLCHHHGTTGWVWSVHSCGGKNWASP